MSVGRVDLLLMLRGLAALSVVVWHVEGYKGSAPAVVTTPGRTAVWLFFGLSGYVIGYGFIHGKYALRRSDLGHFFANRFLRIYPLFLTLSLLALVTIWIQTGRSPVAARDIPAQFLAWQFNQAYVLSGIFWTLGVELHFYALAPLMVVPLSGHRWPTVAAGVACYAAAVLAVQSAVAHGLWPADGRNIVANLPHFFAGMLACRLVWRQPPRVPAAAPLGAAIALIALTNWMYRARPADYWSVPGMVAVDVAIVAFVVAHAAMLPVRVRPNAALAAATWLGVLSYGVYGWHGYFPLVAPGVMDHLLVLAALSIGAAYASYRIIERPALRLKRYSPRVTGTRSTLPEGDPALAGSAS